MQLPIAEKFFDEFACTRMLKEKLLVTKNYDMIVNWFDCCHQYSEQSASCRYNSDMLI